MITHNPDSGHPLAPLHHELRWRLWQRQHIATWTERKLGVPPYFWLFILGVNNSGSTLLVKILESHPFIRKLPKEGQLLTGALHADLVGGDFDRLWTQQMDNFRWTEESDPTPAARIRYDWSYFCPPGPGIILEKSPPNTLRSRWLQRHFEPSRFLALVRHPFAVCEGISRRTGCTLEQAAEHWTLANSCLLEDMKQLDQCLLVRYEDLCEDPERQLCLFKAFLNLETPFDRSVLDAEFKVHNIDNKARRIENLNVRSIERLSHEDKLVIGRIAGEVMGTFGYEANGSTATYSLEGKS